MAPTTNREGMRKALDAMRIGRDPSTKVAEFAIDDMSELLREGGTYRSDLRDFGIRPGDEVHWRADWRIGMLFIRVTLREEALPTFVDLMAA